MSVRKPILSIAALLVVSLLLAPQHTAAQNSSNPYSIIEGWAKLPSGREMGAVGKATVDPDGRHIWAVIRCDAGLSGSEQSALIQTCLPSRSSTPTGTWSRPSAAECSSGRMELTLTPMGNVWVTDAVSEKQHSRGRQSGPSGHQV